MTRERLVQSIVDPSREIAPMFTNWSILTKDGEAKTGIHVGDEVDGRIKFADQNGRVFHVHPNDIDRRQPSSQSVMPAGLADNLTRAGAAGFAGVSRGTTVPVCPEPK